MLEQSPFNPGRPVPVAAFSGRTDLVDRLLDTAKSASRGHFQMAYISGERGIGKSSLAQVVCHLAERDLKMVTAYASLGGVGDLIGLARLTLQSIIQDNDKKSWMEKVKEGLGDRIKAVGAFGMTIELNMPKADLQGVVDNFANEMNGLLQKIGEDRKGLMLVLDDINGLAGNAAFSHWLKSMRDRVTVGGREGPPVFLLFAGLEERRQQMISNNPSVGRIFQPTLFVEPWTDEESRMFFEDGFKRGDVELPPEELQVCVDFSGGLPVLAQEIGHAVWVRLKEELIPLQGISDAAEAIGRQYLESSVVHALHSDHYRAILRKIGRNMSMTATFSKRELREEIGLSDSEVRALDNFINRMRKLGAISPDRESGERGVYRFPSLLHRFYFLLAAERSNTPKRR